MHAAAKVGALAAAAVVAGGGAYALVSRGDDATPGTGAGATQPVPPAPASLASPPKVVTLEQLRTEEGTQGLPIFWAGPQGSSRLELSRSADGSTFVRYLGTSSPGDRVPRLTVATYPRADGFGDVAGAAAQPGATQISLPNAGLAVIAADRPTSVYLSYPDAQYQVEVFAPKAGDAERLVRAEAIVPVGGGIPVAAGVANILDADQLRELALTEQDPMYWAGPQANMRYEFTRTETGRRFIRYLPKGTKTGDPRPRFLTIATYPQADAFAQVTLAGSRPGNATFDVPGGGIGVFSTSRPTSVFVAFPGEAFQMEIFSPKAGEARSLAVNGKIRPVGA